MGLLLMPFRFILWVLVVSQKGFWYGRYYWRRWRPRIKPCCMQLWQRYCRPLIRTLGLGIALTVFVAGVGWVILAKLNVIGGEKKIPSIWMASNEAFLPNTVGHEILAVDVSEGANPAIFTQFNDDLLAIQSILEKEDPTYFKPGQYQAFPSETRKYSRTEALALMKSIESAIDKTGHCICSSQDYFSEALKTHKFDCDTSCFLFLSVARLYNLPIKAVLVPRHMFIRFYLDDNHYINTNALLVLPLSDREIIQRHNVPPDRQGHLYMAPMDTMRVVASYIAYTGYYRSYAIKTEPENSKREKLIPYLVRSMKMDPNNPKALFLARITDVNIVQQLKIAQAETKSHQERLGNGVHFFPQNWQ